LINQSFEEKTPTIKKFVDFDKNNGVCYDNIYLTEHKIVIKIPLFTLNKIKTNAELKFEEFNLDNYIYLLNYE
jgi:hypothetical protein